MSKIPLVGEAGGLLEHSLSVESLGDLFTSVEGASPEWMKAAAGRVTQPLKKLRRESLSLGLKITRAQISELRDLDRKQAFYYVCDIFAGPLQL